ncbi:MAG TPA: cupin domain-containing protein [Kofleriaceae bacterium]|nr:cupin domain-containing protein [Kofleriaceae bacterium]
MTVWRVVCAGLVGAVACGHAPEPAPQQHDNAMVAGPPAAPSDGAEASEDERLAAIQKAMNELRGASQECWAAAATERFDIEGELTFQIAISAGGAQASAVHDTARNTRLTTCVAKLLSAYPWAPPLRGQTIQLPFKFRAPDGQSTIDRALVPWNGQGSGAARVSVAVLLDENNSGNDAASMFELAIAAGGTTGLRRTDRAELWYFLGAGQVGFAGGKHAVAAGDMMYAPKGAAREVAASAEDLHAVIVVTPGGHEGAARSGALPTREATGGAAAPAPVLLPAAAAKTFGPATIFADAATTHDKTLAASIVSLAAGTKVPEHVHAGETELWYMLAGAGTLTMSGVDLPVTATSVVQIPRGAKHAFAVTTDCRALQIFTPAGPEQQLKARP